MTEAVDNYLPQLREQVRNMKIEVRGTADLMPYARNSNVHDDWQIAQIAASIKSFGFLVPVVVQDDGTIAAGHGRVLAAMKLGLEEVPTINAKHLTPTQLRAFIIADNKIPRNSKTDSEMLKVEMEELKVAGFDLAITGFGAAELGDLFAPPAGSTGTEGKTDPDSIPDAVEPRVKPGELWLLGAYLECDKCSAVVEYDKAMIDKECPKCSA